MIKRLFFSGLMIAAFLFAVSFAVFAADSGKDNYDAWCTSCHGEKGDGKGPAADFVWPKPRDFTKGTYKFKSTSSGEPPVDADISRTIRDGNPGTSMPAWPRFSDAEVAALVDYLKKLSPDTFSIKGTPMKINTPPGKSDKLLALGKEMYTSAKCWECHGKAGKGDGEKGWQDKFKDDWGNHIWPADQTSPWEYRAGADLKDVFRTISVGFDGTPMTSYGDTVSEEKRWALAYYVLSQEQERKLGPALRVRNVAALPATTEDAVWDNVEYLDIPLAGQVIFDPRDFTTPIANARVRSVFTATDIAILLEWTDKQPNVGTDGHPPDAARIHFPSTGSEGARPYFFMGDAKQSVDSWQWSAQDNSSAESVFHGVTNAMQPDKISFQAIATYNNGRYRVMFLRPLASATKDQPAFSVGKFMPFAVTVYDGRNDEQNTRGAISAWYFMMLEPPTPLKVYVLPLVVFIVMLIVGVLLHRGLRGRKQ
jgi:DMSO reductase family type II enzyme heme b subunit